MVGYINCDFHWIYIQILLINLLIRLRMLNFKVFTWVYVYFAEYLRIQKFVLLIMPLPNFGELKGEVITQAFFLIFLCVCVCLSGWIVEAGYRRRYRC